MAFRKAPGTLDLVTGLIDFIRDYMGKEQFGPRTFIQEWNQRYNAQLNIKTKNGRLDVSESDLKDEAPAYIFMEMSSIYSGIMSALKKKKIGYEVKPNKKHILDKFTYTHVLARLKNAVNTYIGDLLEHDVPYVVYKQDELKSIKFSDLPKDLKEDAIVDLTKRKSLVDRINLTIAENKFKKKYDENNPKESIIAIRSFYLEKTKLEVYELNEKEERIVEAYRPAPQILFSF